MSMRPSGGGRGGRAVGRLIPEIQSDSDSEQPITAEQNQNHFGKRMGANFYREDSTGTGTVPKVTSKPSSNSFSNLRKDEMIFQLEVLEEESRDLGNFNYRKKLSNHNTGNNSEPLPENGKDVLGLKSRFSPSQDEIIASVAKQLKLIQETQDDILDSLKHDIEMIQTENILLRQNNTRLQSQVSQLNQLVADLSFDLRQMRDLISNKQKLGISLPLSDLSSNIKGRRADGQPSGQRREKESSPPVLTPSQGSINLRSHHPRSQGQKGMSRGGHPGERARMDTSEGGRGGRERRRRPQRSRTQLESIDSTHKHSSCFSGLFGGRRKKVSQDERLGETN